MNLKKINPNLQKALIESELVHANDLQSATFSTIKSGADCVIVSPAGSGKTTTLAMNVLQRLEKPVGESTRALILVEDKEKVLEMVSLFESFGNHMELRVFGTHEKGDIDYDKNHISLGIDVLIGTPNRINLLFSSAGFNMNTVKMFVVDNADVLFRNRMDAVTQRLSESIAKTQRIFTTAMVTERVEAMVEKLMVEPVWFEAETEE